MSCTSPAPWWRTPSKRRFDRCFGLPKNFAAPNQHHPLSGLRLGPGNIAPLPLPSVFSHIHSKTACRGFKSFCPCQKRRYCFCSGAVFCHWAERLGNEARLRPAQCVSWGERAPVALCRGPTEAAAETKSFCPCQKTGENTGFSPVSFFHVLHCYLVHFGSNFWLSAPSFTVPRLHPSPAPKTHPVSPFSGLIPGAFRCFFPLLTCKIFGSVFVHPAA